MSSQPLVSTGVRYETAFLFFQQHAGLDVTTMIDVRRVINTFGDTKQIFRHVSRIPKFS